MEISLRPELERFVKQQIESGRYVDPTEAINAAVQTLKAQAELTPEDIAELRAEIKIGIDQLNRGESALWNAEDVKRRVRDLHQSGR
jgi:antitoxin ParD1/3/4